MRIADGQVESHPNVLPINAQPPVAPPTPVAAAPVPADAPGGVYDATTARLEQASQSASEWAAAMSFAHAANGQHQAYAADMVQTGPGSYGDLVNLPVVPGYAVPAANSDLYPWQGDEPTPAA